MTEPHAVALADLRLRVSQLVASADPNALDAPAPATPGWRAHDVVAHMAGVADDIVNGRRDGIASDAWTGAQVDRRRAMSTAELLADWGVWGPQFEAIVAAAPAEITGQALFDTATHEHDLRHALALPGARDNDAMQHGWAWFVDTRTRAGKPAIRFVTERGGEVAGVGDPGTTVSAPFFELFRATTGRRTAAEMESYEWDPAPALGAIMAADFFTVRSDSLGE